MHLKWSFFKSLNSGSFCLNSHSVFLYSGAISVPTADNRRVRGCKGSDPPAHLQSWAQIGPKWHRGLQAPPFFHWYGPFLLWTKRFYVVTVEEAGMHTHFQMCVVISVVILFGPFWVLGYSELPFVLYPFFVSRHWLGKCPHLWSPLHPRGQQPHRYLQLWCGWWLPKELGKQLVQGSTHTHTDLLLGLHLDCVNRSRMKSDPTIPPGCWDWVHIM